ncbi:L-alanine-DL-glutamate epimerase-like enolase superfamily enzyme [Advenella incenata]|uniref:L-alanine-DL-glutamate epimerase-like enolase superfamily enzyme n=1 Tax=Advenella incenata TaxID=267800 RepID=A0A4Q7VPF3_9BURK|nr:mandelate racemase/muconate lactonizing enzyme family protein [Advenella incenata]RZT98306.1 L-alanine-DL-glutamate epimerase-like enolase superfamily enzyme [Advenella incenata]
MNPNHIVSVDCIPLRLPFHHWSPPPLFAGKPRNKIDSALVRLVTKDGVVAWGESYCAEPDALMAVFEALISPLVQGKDASAPELLTNLQRTLHNLGRSGPIVHALAGLDIALWDLRAKREKVPLYVLLGGKQRSKIRAYASLLQYYSNAELIQMVATRALQEGYTEIKLHERTTTALAAARKAAGPEIPIMVDTNCAWLPSEALAIIDEMKQYDPFWIEEPLWPPEDHIALKHLKNKCNVRLAVGENASSTFALKQLIVDDAVDYVQPSIIKIGISASLAISRECNSKVKCAPQVAYFGPGFLASLHLIASLDYEVALERLYVDLSHIPYAQTVPLVNGWIDVPDSPGLGADPEPDLAQGRYAK